MRIFQISGKGRSGKTTVAKIIAREVFERGYIPVMLPFAKALKAKAEELGYGKETNPEEYRKFCQELGSSKRKDNPDFWVMETYGLMLETMAKELEFSRDEDRDYYEHVIIQDDVRYMNELGLGRELSAIQLFVYSCGRNLEDNSADWRNHESEKLANDVEESFEQPNSEYEELFDDVIDNSGTVAELEEYVKDNLDEWLSMARIEIMDITHDDSDNSDN